LHPCLQKGARRSPLGLQEGGLQKNEWKFEEGWEDRLFALESAAGEISPYRDAAFFHHVVLKKK